MEVLFNRILREVRDQRPCVMTTVVACRGSAPRHVAAKMAVFSDGATAGTIGGGGLERLVIADARTVLKTKRSGLKTYSLDKKDGLQVCGGQVDIFFDVLASPGRLVICGGGHIGLALSLVGKLLNFSVTVIDNRRAFADPSRFPHVDRLICADYRMAFKKLSLDRGSSIVIVTHGHVFDTACLEAALKTPAGYIGMIGSTRKIKEVFGYLRKKGVRPRRLKEIHTPVGLDIGAETPQEIAVAIAAEIIKEGKGRS